MSLGTYIAVAGNIGAGKSSFVSFLEQRYDVLPIFEPNDDNPFLEDFYVDMPRWGFHSQVYFLARKVALHLGLRGTAEHVIQDRTVWEDAEVFARHLHNAGVLSDREHETYRLMYESVCEDLRPPDLLIYLRCPVRTLRRRIRQRGREMEQDLPAKYLRALDALYEDWYERYDQSPKLVFETDRLDPVTDIVDCLDVLDAVDAYVERAR